jgi:hypothetical protein
VDIIVAGEQPLLITSPNMPLNRPIRFNKPTKTLPNMPRNKQKIEIKGQAASIFRQSDEWPEAWMGVDEDLPYGQQLVEAMKPFIESLIDSNLSTRVMKKHMDNLWLLGGEIIRDVSLYEDYENSAPADKLWEAIGPHEGPCCRHLHTASEQQSYDATCDKLYRFLQQNRSD